ncbi:MAG: lysylphosphatidylglycerol synthase transmembrane domain-containing protein [Bacteroidota bacterium]|nr:lysylphosphatidylglycerol synthase transmembrane domain-containing protein [Bacteroidota bacterium]MDP4234204.1 lysylphosphatidylglycerol synthase transmembrane domain-containing protein [Bacteroidota bacterium]MDP4243730.1 lysylphosphatidylglycerol synthase transmembrane domain-containing protein [Bacteroidota bacterium]MDP4287905.1 lysylphosphatidylglycerol synthase transmembrane domain-containing protein [Bacteroidota bacterium]
MKHPSVRYGAAIVVAGVALYFAFRGQHLRRLGVELQGANLLVILAGTGVMFLSHLVRAWRYKMFLRPIAPHTSLTSAFRALIAGYAANNLIPRAGDIIRPVLFSKREDIPVSSSVAVLLIERLTDLVGLTAILIVSILLFQNEIAREFPTVGAAALPIVAALLAIFSMALLIIFSEKKTTRVIHWIGRGLPKRFRGAIEHGAARVEDGLRGVRSGSAIPVILGTLGISAFYTISMYISTLAMPASSGNDMGHVGLLGCFLLQSMSGLAYIMPAPGGTGTYHFFVSQSLATVFGVPPEMAIAFATLTHASNYLLTTIIGVIFMVADGVSLSSARKQNVIARPPIVLPVSGGRHPVE